MEERVLSIMSILIQTNKRSDYILKKPLLVSQVNHCNSVNTIAVVCQEHIVSSSIQGLLVKLRIKDKDEEQSELWQAVSDDNPTIYDPPHIFHVGQDHENLKGNCHQHHIQMGETPCTSWEECKANDQRTLNKTKEDNKNLFRNVRRRKDYKGEPEQKQEPKNTKHVGFNFQEFAERFFK